MSIYIYIYYKIIVDSLINFDDRLNVFTSEDPNIFVERIIFIQTFKHLVMFNEVRSKLL